MEILTKRDKVLLRLLRSRLNKEDIAKLRNLYLAKGGKAARGAARTLTGLIVPPRVIRSLTGIEHDDSLGVYQLVWQACGYARVRPYLAVASSGAYKRGRGGGKADAEARRAWAAVRVEER